VLESGKASTVKPQLVVGVAIATALFAAGCATPVTSPAPAALPAQSPGPHVTLTTEKTISLPGVGGHGDVVVTDPAAHSVYIAQSPDNNLVVLDTATNTVRTVVTGIPSANGIAFDDSHVFVAEAPANAVAVIAKSTWQVVATVPSGGKTPDALYADPVDGAIIVANDDSNNMEEFAASAPFAVRKTLALRPSPAKTGPDLGTYSATDDRVYQSDDNDVLVIDAKTLTIQRVVALPLAAGTAAKDMYYDQARHLLWIATSGPQALALDPATDAVVATVKTASGADQVAADRDRGLLFLGEGKAGVLGVIDLASHRNIADIKIEPDFHTQDHLPSSDLVYAYLNTSNTIAVDKISVQ
jgi:YVTN family beta-propeller protein